jgi:hypothetical protein
MLFLHDSRVIDDDFGRTGAPVRGHVRLAAGWHPLRLYYRHANGEPRLHLTVSGPEAAGGQPQPISSEALATLAPLGRAPTAH